MALPAIKESFHATENQLQMVIAIYGLTYAALVVCSGKLGDIYGRRTIFTTGLWIFLISSLACAFSPSVQMLIFSHFLQGIGASLLAPQVLASIRILFDESERAKALGLFGSVFGLAAIVGQLLGGVLLNIHLWNLTWEIIFLVNVPVAAICLYGIYTTMPKEKVQKQKLDYLGVVLVISALLCFITPLIYGRTYDWAWWIFAIIGGSIALAISFVKYEQYRELCQKPVLLSISLFGNKSFAYNLPIILFYNFTAGLFICYPYYLQSYLGWDVLIAGMAVLPYGIGFFLGLILFAKVDKQASFWIRSGLLLLLISFVGLGILFSQYGTPNVFMHCLFLSAGFGHGLLMPVMMKESIKSIAVDQVGQASGIVSTTIQVGSVLGGAVIGTIFFSLSSTLDYPNAFGIAIAVIVLVQIIGLRLSLRGIRN